VDETKAGDIADYLDSKGELNVHSSHCAADQLSPQYSLCRRHSSATSAPVTSRTACPPRTPTSSPSAQPSRTCRIVQGAAEDEAEVVDADGVEAAAGEADPMAPPRRMAWTSTSRPRRTT
jgi:hypothetical protein